MDTDNARIFRFRATPVVSIDIADDAEVCSAWVSDSLLDCVLSATTEQEKTMHATRPAQTSQLDMSIALFNWGLAPATQGACPYMTTCLVWWHSWTSWMLSSLSLGF